MASTFYKLFTSTKNRDWVYEQCCAQSGFTFDRQLFEGYFYRYADEVYSSNFAGGYRSLIEGQALLDEIHNTNWEFIDYYVGEHQIAPMQITRITDGSRIKTGRVKGETTDELLARWRTSQPKQRGLRDDYKLLESANDDNCEDLSVDCYDEPDFAGGNYAEQLLVTSTARWNSADRTVGEAGFGRIGRESDERLLQIRTDRVRQIPAREIAHTRRFYDRQSAGESMYAERDCQTRGYDMSELRNRTDTINRNRI